MTLLSYNSRLRGYVVAVFACSMSITATPVAGSPLTAGDSRSRPAFDCVIEPSEIVDLGSAVPGVIDKILVERNDFVRKGEAVAELESSVERATVALARKQSQISTSIELQEANAGFAKRTQERSKTLYSTANISEQGMDVIDTDAQIAELQKRQEQEKKRLAELEYRRAVAVLKRRTVHSSVDGVIVERFKSAGEYVDDDPVYRVAQLDPLHVRVVVPIEYYGQIHSGMQADIDAEVPNSESYRAIVDRVDRVADAASGTFGARLHLENPDLSVPTSVRCRLQFQAGDPKRLVQNDVQNDSRQSTGKKP